MSGRAQLCSILYGVCLAAQGEPNGACAVSRSRSARHSGCAVERDLSACCVLFLRSWPPTLPRAILRVGGGGECVWEVSCPRVRAALLCFVCSQNVLYKQHSFVSKPKRPKPHEMVVEFDGKDD